MGKKPIKLISRFQLIAVTTLVLLALIVMVLQIMFLTKWVEHQVRDLRASYVKGQQELIKREVKRVVAIIEQYRARSEDETKITVKQRTYEAIAIAENIYQQNVATKSQAEIEKLILDALRAIRFANGTGYYFATRLDGIELLFADRPELEGKNLLQVQDQRGKLVVQEMIETVGQKGEGYCDYYWTKPTAGDKNYHKISYVKRFAPYNWFIGTGLYVDDVAAQVEADLLTMISKIRFGTGGYVFVNRYNGDALVANGSVVTEPLKLWEFFAKNPEKTKVLFAQEHAAALQPGVIISTTLCLN